MVALHLLYLLESPLDRQALVNQQAHLELLEVVSLVVVEVLLVEEAEAALSQLLPIHKLLVVEVVVQVHLARLTHLALAAHHTQPALSLFHRLVPCLFNPPAPS